MISKLLVTVFLCVQVFVAAAQTKPTIDIKAGKILYITDEKGNRTPDYSFCGYRASKDTIQTVKGVIYVPWQSGDCSALIQRAVDFVAKQKPTVDGFRGAVVLEEGVYELNAPIRIGVSGIVLRGSGEKTILYKKGVDRGAAIYIEGQKSLFSGDTMHIADSYVPVNAQSIHIDGKLQAGDMICVVRPSTKEWIDAVHCTHFGGGETTLGWKAGDADIRWNRTVESVSGNEITLDCPLTIALDSIYGGGYVLRYVSNRNVAYCGVENLNIRSEYNSKNIKDEDHCWDGIYMDKAENCWVRLVNFENLAGSAVVLQAAVSRVTVEDCKSIHPISEIGGMRRQTFLTYGQQTLMQRCYVEDPIHAFVTGSGAAGPNAFVQCEAIRALGFSGALGLSGGALFDIVEIDGNNLTLRNLGMIKCGAGWNSANGMLWQCSAAEIECYSMAADALNRSYACWGQFSGDGEWAGINEHISPRSFFYAQLTERLKKDVSSQARILERNVSATSSPTVEAAMRMAKEAYEPRLTLKKWISDAKRPFVSIQGMRSVKDLKIENTADKSKPVFSVSNGKIVCDGLLLVGSKLEVQWWNGRLRDKYIESSRPHITRFVPGREGLGLTDRIDSVIAQMSDNGVRVLDHNYGLWYDRRRDDHERIRRQNGDTWAPFYEQPFARSGEMYAWDGLSRYDLTQYDRWYWYRLHEFAEKGAEKGLILFHQNYFQHNILEAGAHWVDCPWRSANNINSTEFPEPVPFAGDKRIFVADMFYDINNPVRRELHRAYIRQCLNNFADCDNVVQMISAEFTGPLHFVQFWIDEIAAWEKETGKHAIVALSTTKDVQDAILSDSVRSSVIDVIDIRYWHYKNGGDIYAPEGGKNMAPRQHARQQKVGKVTFEDAYKAVREYREAYPDKAVTFYSQNYPDNAWAVFMAGGSLPVLSNVTNKQFLKAAVAVNPVQTAKEDGYKMVKSDTDIIIYYQSKGDFLPILPRGKYRIYTVNLQSGSVLPINTIVKSDGKQKLPIPKSDGNIYWLKKY